MHLRPPKQIPVIKIPGGPPNEDQITKIVRSIIDIRDYILTLGVLTGSRLILENCPENGYGLPVGGIYADANGFLKIVRDGEAFVPSATVRVKMGVITAS